MHLGRTWQNVTGPDRPWENLTELVEPKRTWQNMREPERTWQNLSELEKTLKILTEPERTCSADQNKWSMMKCPDVLVLMCSDDVLVPMCSDVRLSASGQTVSFYNKDESGEVQRVTFDSDLVKKIFHGSFHKVTSPNSNPAEPGPHWQI